MLVLSDRTGYSSSLLSPLVISDFLSEYLITGWSLYQLEFFGWQSCWVFATFTQPSPCDKYVIITRMVWPVRSAWPSVMLFPPLLADLPLSDSVQRLLLAHPCLRHLSMLGQVFSFLCLLTSSGWDTKAVCVHGVAAGRFLALCLGPRRLGLCCLGGG